MKIFSDRLRLLRDDMQILSKDLAKELNITESKLSYYMNDREPDFETLVKISNYFNVSCDYLLGCTDLKKYEDKNLQEIIFKNYSPDTLTKEQMDIYMGFQEKTISILEMAIEMLSSSENNENADIYSDLLDEFSKIISDAQIQFRNGEIYLADLGNDLNGLRAVLIIQNDIANKYSPTTMVSPLTTHLSKPGLPTHVELIADKINNLPKDCIVLLEQVRTIDKRRLKKKLGELKIDDIEKVQRALAISFGIINKYEQK